MEPKPLTAADRAEIERILRDPTERTGRLEALLAAEQYWREAVKRSPESYRYAADGKLWTGETLCWFCGGEWANQGVHHKPDCPWLLAQE